MHENTYCKLKNIILEALFIIIKAVAFLMLTCVEHVMQVLYKLVWMPVVGSSNIGCFIFIIIHPGLWNP